MLSWLLWVLVLVPSGRGRGFAYKAELSRRGKGVRRGWRRRWGRGRDRGAGSVGGRGRGAEERGGAGLACAELEGEATRRGAEVYELGEG